MPVREVDPLDEASFGRWAAVVEASLQDERPGEPTPSPGEELAAALSLLRPGAAYSGVLLTATRDGQAVGVARLRAGGCEVVGWGDRHPSTGEPTAPGSPGACRVNGALGYRPAGGTSLWSLEPAAPVARTGRAQPGR